MNDMAIAEDRTRFDEAHPPLMMELTDDEGERVEVPTERLPRLLFWHVLLRPWVPPKRTKGGIMLPGQVAEANEHHVPCYQVLQIGPLAFTHPRLNGGPREGWRREWDEGSGETCWREEELTEPTDSQVMPKVGDWVLIKKHCGARYKIAGAQILVCNDDDILGVIDGPSGWASYIDT